MKPFLAYVYYLGCNQPKAVTIAEVLDHKVLFTEPDDEGFTGAKIDCVYLTMSQALIAQQLENERA